MSEPTLSQNSFSIVEEIIFFPRFSPGNIRVDVDLTAFNIWNVISAHLGVVLSRKSLVVFNIVAIQSQTLDSYPLG